MPTLLDIARRAGLAKSTAAAILRGEPGFNDRTRRHVLAVAAELGYQPNVLGRALAGGPSLTIGALIGSFDPAMLWKVQALESAARQQQYLTYVLFAADRSRGPTLPMARSLLERRVDGLIVFNLAPLDDDLLAFLRQAGKPVCYIDWAPPGTAAHVRIDNEPGMRQVAEHLAELGHRRVAFLGLDFDRRHPTHKLAPYRRAMKGVGIQLISGPKWTVQADVQGNYQSAVYDLVRRRAAEANLPSAIVTCDDELALGIVAALRDAKLRVPEDVSVVGFDDHPIAQHAQPALTTLRQPRGEVGAAAFAILSQWLADPQAQVAPAVFQAQRVVRQSTGPAPRRGRK